MPVADGILVTHELLIDRSDDRRRRRDISPSRIMQNVDAARLTSDTLDVSCCGKVYKKTPAPGRYAFVVTDSTAAKPGLPPRSLATITVEP
jgi:hypothetical protein